MGGRVAAAVVHTASSGVAGRSVGRLRRRAGARRGRVAPAAPRALARPARRGDELVVVDDHSSDATAAVAAAHGAKVVAAPDLPAGWVGKPHACSVGAAVTTAPLLVFLDADVRPGPDLLAGLAAAIADDDGAVVSVQPWQDSPGPAALAAVVTMMGSGGFTLLGERLRPTVAFGPVLAMTRATYDRAGGHAQPDVRGSLTEDIALARHVGCSRVASDRRDATMRRQGWSRTLAAGIEATRWWLVLGVAAWVWSLAGRSVRRLDRLPAERAAGVDPRPAGRSRRAGGRRAPTRCWSPSSSPSSDGRRGTADGASRRGRAGPSRRRDLHEDLADVGVGLHVAVGVGDGVEREPPIDDRVQRPGGEQRQYLVGEAPADGDLLLQRS